METEIWKDIEGYEGKYQVSNLGRVKSLNYKRSGKEQCLELSPDKDGYLMVCLYKNERKKLARVNRLVAIAFIPNPEGKPEVDHINNKTGNKAANRMDNRAVNLRWVTSIENKNNGQSKKVLCIETGEVFPSAHEAERCTGAYNTNIIACCRGKLKTTKGYHWRYAD